MNTVTIEIGDERHDFTTPENWEECSNRQLMRIWDTYNQDDGLKGVAPFQLFHMVCFLMATPCAGEKRISLMGLRKRFKLIENALDEMVKPEDEPIEREHQTTVRSTVVVELLETMEFMKEPLRLHTSRCPWLFGWRGFKTQFSGMCVEQFALANTKLKDFLEHGEEQYLNELVAVLYRPFFMPWMNRFGILELYAWMARKFLPKHTKLRLMMFWKGHLDFMLTFFPELTRTKNDDDDPDPYGWESTFIGLAGEKFGTYKQVKRADVLPALINLEQHAKRQHELEAELENKKQ